MKVIKMLNLYGGAGMLPGYSMRKLITIDNTGNPVALSANQLQITLTSDQADVFTAAMTNGEDIRFTSIDGVSLLNYWIQSYDKSGNTATIYVKVTGISNFSIGKIYMYYGKPGSVSASSWTNTMQRFESSLSGGDTQYLISANEGSGATLSNTGSVEGSLSITGTAPTWQGTNAYGQSGTVPRLNGTNNYILIPTLLDTWPVSGEISFTFRVNTLPTGGSQIALIEKFNRIGTAFPDLGNKFGVYVFNAGTGINYVRIQNFVSNLTTPSSFVNYSSFIANDINQTNILAGTTHTVSIIWTNGAMAFYVDGLFAGRHIHYFQNGHGSDFTIGAQRDQVSGSLLLFSNIDIQDFRYTDYTNGTVPRLPQIEAEHSQTRFIQKNIRSKMQSRVYLVATNIKARNGRMISAADATNPQYNTPLLEPVILYDTDDGKYKMWYNDLFSPLGVQFYYREAATLAGLATATEVVCTKSGTNYPQRLTIYKEAGVFHLFYSNRIQAGVNALVPIYHQTSTDGKNFTTETTALSVPGSGFGSIKGFENTGAIQKIGSTYYILVEAWTGSSNETGLATASNIAGPYSIMSGLSPITSIEYNSGANNDGGPGSHPILYNGNYYFIYHSQWNNTQVGQTVYDETYFAKTPDYSTFTKINSGGPSNVAGRAFDDPFATDQFADPDWTTDGNKVQFVWNAVQNQSNTNFFGTVEVSEFDGNLQQLLTDLTISINSSSILYQDATAEAFIAMAGITNSLQRNTISYLCSKLNAANLLTKAKAIYPYVGGTANNHKFNLKNPQDTDAAYRIVWNGTVTHNANGVTFDGATGYGDTKLNPSTVYGTSYLSMHTYNRSGSAGITIGGTGANYMLYNDGSGGGNFANGGAQVPVDLINTGMISITGSNIDNEVIVDGRRVYSVTTGGNATNGNTNLLLGRFGAASLFFSNHNVAFQAIFDSLTEAETVTLHSIVDQFQSLLGRRIAQKTFSYFYGDSITYGYQVNNWQLYHKLLAVDKGWLASNRGINGSSMQNYPPTPAPSMINRLSDIPVKQANDDSIFFAYGVNDSRYQDQGVSGFSVATFQSNLATVIAKCVTNGWPLSKIYIIDGWYQNATGQGSANALSLYNQIRTAAQNQCALSGCKYLDPFSSCVDSDLQADNLHLNASGHSKSKTYILANL